MWTRERLRWSAAKLNADRDDARMARGAATWCPDPAGCPVCRADGSTPLVERPVEALPQAGSLRSGRRRRSCAAVDEATAASRARWSVRRPGRPSRYILSPERQHRFTSFLPGTHYPGDRQCLSGGRGRSASPARRVHGGRKW